MGRIEKATARQRACVVCRREVAPDGTHVVSAADGHAARPDGAVIGWTVAGLAVWSEMPPTRRVPVTMEPGEPMWQWYT